MNFHILRQASSVKYHLYFVMSPIAEMVKIGITGDLSNRLATLRHGSPVGLVLLVSVRGTALHESSLHRHFAAERRHGEWFVATPRLLAFVDTLKHSTPAAIQEMLDSLVGTPLISRRAWEQPKLPFRQAQQGRHWRRKAASGDSRLIQLERAKRLWRSIESLMAKGAS